MTKTNPTDKIDPTVIGKLATLVSYFTYPWALMLIVGALGHWLDLHWLYRVNYLNTLLIYVAVRLLVDGYKVTEE